LSESRGQRTEPNHVGDATHLMRDTRALKLYGHESGPLKIVSCELLRAGTSVRIDDCYRSPMIRVRCSERPFEGRYLIDSDAVKDLEDQLEARK
jgi:hypothetical protein